jgi:ribonuclease Y
MTTTILIIGAAIGGGLLSLIGSQIVQRTKAGSRIKKSEQQAKRIIKKAHQESDRIKKDKMLQAKERFIELKSEHEKAILSREKKVEETEKRALEKESNLNK